MDTLIFVVAALISLVLIAGPMYMIYIGKGNSFTNGAALFFGFVLILALVVAAKAPIDEIAANWKDGHVTVKTKTGPRETELALKKADDQIFVEFSRKVEETLHEQDDRIKRVVASLDELKKGVSPQKIAVPTIASIARTIAVPNIGSTVLVFYRSNKSLAHLIVGKLQEKGYKSAAAESSLDEISKWVNPPPVSGKTIFIPATGDNLALAKDLRSLILTIPNSSIDPAAVFTDKDWAFKSSDAQIYIF